MAETQSLNDIFLAFASYGTRQPETQLDNAKFAKLFKDSGLLDKKFTSVDCDLIFSKVKTKGARKISFPEFQKGLEQAADKKGLSLVELEETIITAGGPKTKATKADYVKFHDDKSTFTGVHAKGGPTTVDGDKDLASLTQGPAPLLSLYLRLDLKERPHGAGTGRSPADNRGVSATFAKQH